LQLPVQLSEPPIKFVVSTAFHIKDLLRPSQLTLRPGELRLRLDQTCPNDLLLRLQLRASNLVARLLKGASHFVFSMLLLIALAVGSRQVPFQPINPLLRPCRTLILQRQSPDQQLSSGGCSSVLIKHLTQEPKLHGYPIQRTSARRHRSLGVSRARK
jgi:hypothetical protein